MMQFIKKTMIFGLGMLLAGIFATTHAASYMYCTKKDGSYSDWVRVFDIKDKVIPVEWQGSVHFEDADSKAGTGYVYLWGGTSGHSEFGSHPTLDVDAWIDFAVRDEEHHLSKEASLAKAQRFCAYLKSFCPDGYPYLEVSGGHLSASWWSHIYMKWSSGSGNSYVCPNWQYPTGSP